MTNKVISGLTAATTPLAGTELVPVWDGVGTKQVTVANLTAGRAVATGALTVTGAVSSTVGGNLATSSGNINVGAGTAGAKLHVVSPVATDALRLSDATNYTVAMRSGGVGVGFITGTAGSSLALGANNVEYARVTTAGLVVTGTITPTGNITQGTAAKGINFTANTPAAGMTSQLLNWYEEGTWTPTFTYATPGTMTSSQTKTGYYTRIGRVVHFTGDIRFNAFTKGTASGALTITGLPFTALNTGGYANPPVSLSLYQWAFTTQPVGAVISNTTTLTLHRLVSDSAFVNLDDPDSNAIVFFSGFYFI